MRLMKPFRTIGTLLLACSFATAVLAHDTWLIPQRFAVMPNATVQLDLTSGMAFPRLETSIKPGRLDRAKCRLAEDVFGLFNFSPAPKSLRFQTVLLKVGVATCWVELEPKALELTPKQVKEYLDEIDAPAAVRKEWVTAQEPRHWRELYTKHAKTFIKVGDGLAGSSWAEPVGMSLEIVPESDPTAIRGRSEFVVRVLEKGLPLSNFSVGLVREGSHKGQIRKTDNEGRVRFRLATAGRWLFRGTKLRKGTQTGIDWESDFTTLTVNVK
jgi:uncharacterized GH25 family protein